MIMSLVLHEDLEIGFHSKPPLLPGVFSCFGPALFLVSLVALMHSLQQALAVFHIVLMLVFFSVFHALLCSSPDKRGKMACRIRPARISCSLVRFPCRNSNSNPLVDALRFHELDGKFVDVLRVMAVTAMPLAVIKRRYFGHVFRPILFDN